MMLGMIIVEPDTDVVLECVTILCAIDVVLSDLPSPVHIIFCAINYSHCFHY